MEVLNGNHFQMEIFSLPCLVPGGYMYMYVYVYVYVNTYVSNRI